MTDFVLSEAPNAELLAQVLQFDEDRYLTIMAGYQGSRASTQLPYTLCADLAGVQQRSILPSCPDGRIWCAGAASPLMLDPARTLSIGAHVALR